MAEFGFRLVLLSGIGALGEPCGFITTSAPRSATVASGGELATGCSALSRLARMRCCGLSELTTTQPSMYSFCLASVDARITPPVGLVYVCPVEVSLPLNPMFR